MPADTTIGLNQDEKAKFEEAHKKMNERTVGMVSQGVCVAELSEHYLESVAEDDE